MKYLILTFFFIFNAHAEKRFDGYIVKLKRHRINLISTLEALGELKKLRIPRKHIYKLKRDKELNENLLQALNEDRNIEYIEPDYYYYHKQPLTESSFRELTEKKGFERQWGLKNRGKKQRGRQIKFKEGIDISAENIWEIRRGDRTTTVAIIDTGIDYDHPDLKENIWINEKEKNGQPGVDDDKNGYVDDIYGWDFAKNISDPIDNEWGHGTHVAGIVGAKHNTRGIKGVMNDVQLMALKIFNKKAEGEARSPTSGIIEALAYAAQMKVKVINASWGGGDYSKALEEAIQDLRDENIVFVTTAGNHKRNNDETPYFPAGYDSDNIVVVGSYNGVGNKSWFSGYGNNSVHVFAPGEDILSTLKRNYIQEFEYGSMSGTSMAAPHVAGIIGVAFSKSYYPFYQIILNALEASSIKTKELEGMSKFGRVDGAKFLKSLNEFFPFVN